MTDDLIHHVRWILVLILTSTACSRGKCTDRPKQEPLATTPPAQAGERQLTIDGVEARVWGPGPQATFADTTTAEHEAIAKLIPRLLEGSRAFFDKYADRGWHGFDDIRGLARNRVVSHAQIRRPESADYRGGYDQEGYAES